MKEKHSQLLVWHKAWALLEAGEKRSAAIVLAALFFGALTSAVMVGSIMPFLSVIAEPERVHAGGYLTWAYQRGGFSSEYRFLWAIGIVSLLIILVASILQIAKVYAVARFSMMRSYSLSQRLLAVYLRQPYEFFLNQNSGELSTRILSETNEVVLQFFRPAAELLAAGLTLVAIVALLLMVNPQITIVVFFLLLVVYGAFLYAIRNFLRALGRQRLKSNQKRFRVIGETFGGIKEIKLLGREGPYIAQYRAPSRRMAEIQVQVLALSSIPQYILQAVAFSGVIGLSLFLLDPVQFVSGSGTNSLISLLGVFAFAALRMMPEISRFFAALAKLQASGPAVEVVYRDLVDRVVVAPASRDYSLVPMGLQKTLVLDGVSYEYPGAELSGIDDLSLEIQSGERIGIVGTTGAGKSTLVDLVLGLLRPTRGEISVDGITLNDANLPDWQQSIGYVPQDIFLVDASVAENIAFGECQIEIDEIRMRQAAAAAQIADHIENSLSEGYNTRIGERGVKLSGGQRQRIGIARALYRDADLLVFDEATSALDSVTERAVMQAINELPGHKTVFLVAHRVSTLESCDRIIVLKDGRIDAVGTWSELRDDNEFFRGISYTQYARTLVDFAGQV